MLESRMKPGTSPFQQFVQAHARLFQSGIRLPLGGRQRFPQHFHAPDGAPRVLLFSPHPDDECIVGGLALRLLREAKWRVINVAVTLGSKRQRRSARLRELKNACRFLGFDLVSANLGEISPTARRKHRARWRHAVKTIAGIVAQHRPRVIFVPHEGDIHPAHVGTHLLVSDALRSMLAAFHCHVVQTEFWGQMTCPNLLVESSVADVADLIAALAYHVGEVRRNPYHARLPAWLMDNVRRGAELVGGRGGVAPGFTFGTLYRVHRWSHGRLKSELKGGSFLNRSKNPAGLF